MNRTKSLFPLVVLATAVVMPGCSDDETSSKPGPVPETQTSSIRVIHVSPDAPAVDVFVGGKDKVVSSLAFGDSSEFIEVPAASYDFNVAPAGATPAESVLNINGLELMAGKKYTAVAYGNVASIQALALEEDYADVPADQIRVRAIHAAPAVGAVDIWNITDAANPTPLYTGVSFGDTGQYLDIPAQAYTLGFDVDADAMPDVIFEIPALPAGTVANLVATQNSGGDVVVIGHLDDSSTVELSATTPPPAMASIRVAHLSPDAPAVDVYAGDTKVVPMLEFPKGTSYLSVEAGIYSFHVAPAGTSVQDSVLDIDGLELMGGKSYTAVAFDQLSSIKALALVDDYSGLAAGNIRIRAIHAANGVGMVDIWNITDPNSPSPLFTQVDFGDVSAYADVPAAAYVLGFDVDADAVPDLTFDVPELPAGQVANVFAVNDGAVFLAAQLTEGDIVRIDAN